MLLVMDEFAFWQDREKKMKRAADEEALKKQSMSAQREG